MARLEPVKSPERQRVPHEGDRRLPPHPGHRLRGRRGPLRAGPGLSATRPGEPDAGKTPTPGPDRGGREPVDPDELAEAGGQVADRKIAPADGSDPGPASSPELVVAVHEGPPAPVPVAAGAAARPGRRRSARSGSRRPTAELQAAIGRTLEVTHKALHERLKPDETAEGRAFAIARKNDPAANMNAQSIVIHSLHRPGAPGHRRGAVGSRPPQTTPTKRPTSSTPASRSGEWRMIGHRMTGSDQAPEPAWTACSCPCGRGLRHAGREGRHRRARGPGASARGQGRDFADRQVRRHHEGRGHHFRPRQRRASAKSCCPRRWARASRSSTTTATATRTCSSSTRRPWPGHEAKPRADPGPLPQRRQGALRGRHEGGRARQDLLRQGVAVGDYDNDGDPDLYITAIGGGHLFRNDGKGTSRTSPRPPTPGAPTAGSPAPRSSTWRTTATSTCSSATTSPGRPRSTRSRASSSPALGRAYGPPTSFNGSLCALLAQRWRAGSPTSARSRASRSARPT